MDLSILLTGTGLFYLVFLTLLEIVLGIDNIIFISIITDKLPKEAQRKSRNIGLALALIVRLILLTFVSWIMKMTVPFFELGGVPFTGQSLVLLIGGLFLIYKSTIEIHNNIKGHQEVVVPKKNGLRSVIFQIIMVDIVFSFDSIITAIGMTNGMGKETGGDPMIIIYSAVIISMIVMLIFVKPISDFINDRPTIKMIALAFLVTIGVILVAESFGQHVPKGYIYFGMVYALSVEFMNIRMRKNSGEE